MAMGGPSSSAQKSFHLYENEELITCPYNLSHHVTNCRLMNHLVKCRRNYEREMQQNGDMVPMFACKFNWCHHVPAPEILLHENSCPDRYNIVSHILKFIDSNPDKPGYKKSELEMYVSAGIPRDSTIITDGSTASRTPIPRPGLAQSFRSSQATKGDSTTPRSESLDPNIAAYPPRARAAMEISIEEDWEPDCERRDYKSYDPSAKFETELLLKYPPNLTKSERKAWRIKNMEKAERMFGGRIPSVLPHLPETNGETNAELNPYFRPRDDPNVQSQITEESEDQGTYTTD